MNITMRKMALLEKTFAEQEERNRIEGYTSIPINEDLKKRVSYLMDQVRYL